MRPSAVGSPHLVARPYWSGPLLPSTPVAPLPASSAGSCALASGGVSGSGEVAPLPAPASRSSRADRHRARQAKPLRGRLRRAWPTRHRPAPWKVDDGTRGDSAQRDSGDGDAVTGTPLALGLLAAQAPASAGAAATWTRPDHDQTCHSRASNPVHRRS